MKFSIGRLREDLLRNSRLVSNLATISGALHEDLSTIILLAAVRNILQRDNSKKGTHCCFSMATLNGFVLLTATYM